MANYTKRKRVGAKPPKNVITCPFCDSLAQLVNVPSSETDMMMLSEGPKYVCTGKFIYRTRTDNLQLSPCYGLPIEFSIKQKQFGDSQADAVQVMKNFSHKYIQAVFEQDLFFKNLPFHVPAVREEVPVPVNDDDKEFDPKAEMHS